ncbi:MAG: hypothetical protein JWO70_762 [Betaproteobacteria bacterium]|nr:hypothetical protein [Betaproteobacteria bacterium]
MSTTALLPVGAGTKALALPGTADVSDELKRAGMSFGKLIQNTGQAVADTQLKLNQTGAAMASTLATTQVDVIAVQESIYDDDGNLDQAKTFTRKLPLINFIDPVFYEWTAVRLQGQFYARELVTSNESAGSAFKSSDGLGNAGYGIIFGVGYIHSSNSSTTTNSDVDTSSDASFGHIRASALLQPKRDIGVPAPRQVVRGPSLNIVAGEIKDILTNNVLTARTMSALLELRKQDGTPIADKSISIDTEGAPWSFTDPAVDTTDAQGQVAITLRRDFIGNAPDTSVKDVIVTARLGLVSNSTTLTF